MIPEKREHKHWRSCDKPIEAQMSCMDEVIYKDCETCSHYTVITTTDCPECLNQKWAKWLLSCRGKGFGENIFILSFIDYEALKKLIQEEDSE